MKIERIKRELEEYMQRQVIAEKPQSLFDPVNYIMSTGGKRIRPLICLLMSTADKKELNETALNCAYTIELFHNFTLVHDDIMDKSEVRRGRKTVHRKYTTSKAILSGDAMLILCFKRLSHLDHPSAQLIMQNFINTALQVCRGQELDMTYEKKSAVSYGEYIEMVRLKTAVLLGLSFYTGSLLGGFDVEEADKMRRTGEEIGIAFQMQDDYLDTYGESSNTGKVVGGDILNGKKTLLYHYALSNATDHDRKLLIDIYNDHHKRSKKDIATVLNIYNKYSLDKLLSDEIERYRNRVISAIRDFHLPHSIKKELLQFLPQLTVRDS